MNTNFTNRDIFISNIIVWVISASTLIQIIRESSIQLGSMVAQIDEHIYYSVENFLVIFYSLPFVVNFWFSFAVFLLFALFNFKWFNRYIPDAIFLILKGIQKIYWFTVIFSFSVSTIVFAAFQSFSGTLIEVRTQVKTEIYTVAENKLKEIGYQPIPDKKVDYFLPIIKINKQYQDACFNNEKSKIKVEKIEGTVNVPSYKELIITCKQSLDKKEHWEISFTEIID